MSLLDLTEDPKSYGLLSLGLRLLSTPGKFGQAIGQAGMGSMKDIQDFKEAKRQQELRDMQKQQLQMSLDTQKRQMAGEQATQAYATQALTPTPGIMANQMSGLSGPTPQAAQAIGKTPGFDLGAALKAGVPLSAALQLQATMAKDESPLSVAEGTTLLNRKTMQPVFSNPKASAEDSFVRLLKGAGIDPMSAQGQKLLRDRILKESTHTPGVNVSYGAPVAGVDDSGKPVFFQPGKSGGPPSIVPGVAPPKREAPAALQEKLAQNAVTLNKIDKAIAMVDKNPNALGMQNVLGDPIMQRLDPKGVEVRAMVADIGGQKIHDRSGAAVTLGEAERLKPYIPAATDSPDTVKKKLRLFRSEYAAMQQAIQSGASVTQASQKGGDTKSDKTITRTGMHNGKKVNQYSDGSIEYAD